MYPVPEHIVDIFALIFTISLALTVLLLVRLGPKGWLEWAIVIRSFSYFLVLFRACFTIYFDFDRNNLIGIGLFIFATLATVWFCIVSYAAYWEVTRGRPGWFTQSLTYCTELRRRIGLGS